MVADFGEEVRECFGLLVKYRAEKVVVVKKIETSPLYRYINSGLKTHQEGFFAQWRVVDADELVKLQQKCAVVSLAIDSTSGSQLLINIKGAS